MKRNRAIVVCFMLVLAAFFAIASSKPSESTKGTPAKQAEQSQEEAQLTWLSNIRTNCSNYEAAPNEIKKSAVFKENESFLKTVIMNGVKGKLSKIETTQGGEDLRVEVKVAGISFDTEIIFNSIKKGSKVYKQAAEMKEDDCVVFSTAKGITAASVVERSKVCDEDYNVVFTDLKACN